MLNLVENTYRCLPTGVPYNPAYGWNMPILNARCLPIIIIAIGCILPNVQLMSLFPSYEYFRIFLSCGYNFACANTDFLHATLFFSAFKCKHEYTYLRFGLQPQSDQTISGIVFDRIENRL